MQHMFVRDLVAMQSLGGSLYLNGVVDIICWYEIRSFFNNFYSQLWSQQRSAFPVLSILLSTLLFFAYAAYEIFLSTGIGFVYKDPNGIHFILFYLHFFLN